ncbi:hypothetical protein CEXT_511581 [Caerostris extrusa]|uniref:Uncharacterized protein n=1 Tax=Caerostris extrusa TaxID=172846 RepID=A0AAV4XAL1_CAEEX|nr:hypothetical protein CEXT_511581 [Caerostris extrusa]
MAHPEVSSPRPFTIVTLHVVPAIAVATADISWGFEISVTTSSLTPALLEEQQLAAPPPKSCMAIHTLNCAKEAVERQTKSRPFTLVTTFIHAVPAIALATADLSWGFEISVTTSSLTSALLEEQQLAPLPRPHKQHGHPYLRGRIITAFEFLIYVRYLAGLLKK